MKRGQLDIPKGHNSECFYSKSYFASEKVHYSEDIYPNSEDSLFRISE